MQSLMIRIFLIFALEFLVLPASIAEPGPLVIVGGGSVPPEAHRRLVELGGGRDAHVVVVPFASSLMNAGEGTVGDLRPFGARSVEILSGTNRAQQRRRSNGRPWFGLRAVTSRG
jgi:hypothetical protein